MKFSSGSATQDPARHEPLTAAVVLLAVLAGVAAGAGLVRLWTASIGVDQAWGLYAALQILHGVQLNGSKLVEVNPPFILWFMAVPAWLSEQLRLSPIAVFRVFEISLFLVLGAWAAHLYTRTREASRVTLWCLLLGFAYFGCFTMTASDLGEREHFVTFFLLPYLMLAVLRLEGGALERWEGVLAGLCAAVAICLKPQQILDLGALELLLLVRLRRPARWFDLSLVACALGVAAYFVAVQWTNPNYARDIVPLLQQTYWGFDAPWPKVLVPARRMLAGLAIALVCYGLRRKHLRNEKLEAVLLAVSVGSLAAFVQQHKGWVYQMVPFRFYVYLVLIFLAADTLLFLRARQGKTARTAPYRLPWLCAGLALMCSIACFAALDPFSARAAGDPVAEIGSIYRELPAGSHVGLISMDAWAFPSLLEQHKVWSSRYMHLWMLPALIKSQDPQDPSAHEHLSAAQANAIARTTRTAVADDLASYRPVLVAVDPCGWLQLCPAFAREGFGDTLGWLMADPAFRSQWAHYTFARMQGSFAVYKRTS